MKQLSTSSFVYRGCNIVIKCKIYGGIEMTVDWSVCVFETEISQLLDELY